MPVPVHCDQDHLNQSKTINHPNPVDPQDVATKDYVDTTSINNVVSTNVQTLTGTLVLNANSPSWHTLDNSGTVRIININVAASAANGKRFDFVNIGNRRIDISELGVPTGARVRRNGARTIAVSDGVNWNIFQT